MKKKYYEFTAQMLVSRAVKVRADSLECALETAGQMVDNDWLENNFHEGGFRIELIAHGQCEYDEERDDSLINPDFDDEGK